MTTRNHIRLFVEAYSEPHPERFRELHHCLEANAANQWIDEVVVFTGSPIALVRGPAYPKITHQLSIRRLTYAAAIDEANKRLTSPYDISIIANSDIEFDDSLSILAHYHLGPNRCFALSRWDDGAVRVKHDSQDAWVFQGQIRDVECDFCTGKAGCDNRFAWELQKAGYKVHNPALLIRAHHRHASGIRHYSRANAGDVVQGPYLLVPASDDLEDAGANERVLHVALNGGGRQDALCAALASLGQYRELDWQKASQSRSGTVHSALTSAAMSFNPTLTFMQIQTDNVIDAGSMKNVPGFTANWTGDVRTPMLPFYRQLAPHVSVTLFSNQEQAWELSQQKLRADYFQIGFDPQVFRPDGPKAKPAFDIVWMGNDYGERFPLAQLRREMVARLKNKYGKRFGVFGQCPQADGNLMADKEAEAACYRSCKIAINLSHYRLSRYTSDRMFRIMGCGTFCLTHDYPEIEEDFMDGVHVRTWNTLNQLEQLIDYYLTHDEERDCIARQGTLRVHLRDTWAARMVELKRLKAKYSAQPLASVA